MAAALAALTVGVLFVVVFSKPVRTYLDLSAQLNAAREQLADLELALHRRRHVEALCKEFEQRILATGSDAEEQSLLLKELESLTRGGNVEVKSIRPLACQPVGGYRRFLVSLEIQARVHNMFELLYAIDTSPKILTVESLQIQASRAAPNLLSANMMISRTSASNNTETKFHRPQRRPTPRRDHFRTRSIYSSFTGQWTPLSY
jgi:Tfp pilus assembly protein PilO